MGKTLIIGAGITGLSVAWHLEGPYLVLERARKPGGLCASEKINGCTFDYSGHFLHFHHPETRSLVENVLLKGNLDAVDRSTWIHTHGCWVPFPFQANLHALPPAIREECVRGARKRPALAKKKFTSLEEWSLSVFGAGITKYFMKPYNEKLWSFPAAKLNSDWTAPFVPKPPLKEILEGAESASGRRYGYNARFYYPRSGGAQALIDALAARVSAKGRLSLGAEVRSVDLDRKTVTTLAGRPMSTARWYRPCLSPSSRASPKVSRRPPGRPPRSSSGTACTA